MQSFERIAIVNRGEAAVRLIRAVGELRQEEGEGPLRTIALYTEPDRSALFVREADEAVSLGSAMFVDPADSRRKNRYLDYEALERALVECRAEAAWVGWGFVSEHARFAELCQRLGVVFIGPNPEVMLALGDKIGSKRMAEKAGVPVAPWSGGPVSTLGEARSEASRLGFPLMIKATSGGGGRGIRRVRSVAEIEEAFESARSEALVGFGDDRVFMERLVEGARHVEVQIIGDGQGTTWALGVRDCTVQRRNQKVLEESPSPGLDADQHEEICKAAARLGDLAGYCGAGTVEFLYDPKQRLFSFMEVNARLQVEHPVTELTTGVDLVKMQIRVARGERLVGGPPEPRGHAIEARVNAEDPERGFAPSPGRIELMRLPGGPGIRVDSGFIEGDTIAPEFDSMIAKLIAYGRDREEALARLERGLRGLQVGVRGGTSNKGFLLGLLERKEVRSGEVDVGWLDRLAAQGEHLSRRHADVALVQAAVDAYEAEHVVERSHFYATAARGRLRPRREVGANVELRHGGRRYAIAVARVGPQDYRVSLDGVSVAVGVERLGPLERRLTIGEHTYRSLILSGGLETLVEIEGIPHRVSREDVGMVRSPAPAVVIGVAVAPGDKVARGDRLVVLESMKTELAVASPCSGRVREVLASANVQVEAGAPLVVIEPDQSGDEVLGGETVDFQAIAQPATAARDAAARCLEVLEELRRFALGFDIAAPELARLSQERARLVDALPAGDPGVLRREDEILAVFADQAALLQRSRSRDAGETEDVRTPEEYLLLFLRSLDAGAAGLSPSYVHRLQRALSHYGVDGVERSPALEEALLWVCKAHSRIDEQASLVLSILERRLDAPAGAALPGDEAFHDLLDRIVAVAGSRHQAVSDLARELRYRTFDRTFFEELRARAYEDVEGWLREAAEAAEPAVREQAMQSLVGSAQPLAPLLTIRMPSAAASDRAVAVEALLRRYYRVRELENVRVVERSGRSHAIAEYQHEGKRIRVVTAHATWSDAPALGPDLEALLEDVPSGEDVVVDLYLCRDGTETREPAEELASVLAAWSLARPLRRVVFAVTEPEAGRGMDAVTHFAFRPSGSGFAEDTTAFGLHPMMAKRLELWRLSNFDVERVPSAPDVYLFHGVARDHPRDERLFAFVEVRDVTPLPDARGQSERLPHLERQVQEAIAAIRLFQSRRNARRRLHWNRIILFVWPPHELGVEQVQGIAHRLLPLTEGLGLQKIVARSRIRDGAESTDSVVQIATPGGDEVAISIGPPADQPIAPLSEFVQRVVRMRQRGMVYPYELIQMLTPPRDGHVTGFPPGEFQEYDLDGSGEIVPVDREPGGNVANLVVGVIRNFTPRHPGGMVRVAIFGDPSRDMGCFAELECRRIISAIDLAESMGVPLEWFPVSAGAKIAMDSGTENLDWTALALRRLIEYTQAGGAVNVVVVGVNVGGQSYWNAEATMLMHTRGALIMTSDASMVLTGKRALDYSGGVSAEDNVGIGGYDKVMGVNGEAQYWAQDVVDACRILFRFYDHAYVSPGERSARRATTDDPSDRDVCSYPYESRAELQGGSGEAAFERIGEIWSDEHNPGRRRPFAIRPILRAVIDQDHEPLERWADMREAEVAVVWDAHLGGIPACLIGIESEPVPRLGFVPADGPEQWTPGTLFPLSSKKVARAINAASGSRPVVVLANLSGFDGSPESLRRLQLEYGAEIGRAVVNFEGPIVFCVVNRYHGGAYVVFSRALNPWLEAAALEGAHASVIGGAPAAAVVFAGEVDRRTKDDPRLVELGAEIEAAEDPSRARLRTRWHELYDAVRSEKLGEVADEFDGVHSVERARSVGSLDEIVTPSRLRPYLIEALERGLARWTAGSEHGEDA